MPVGPLVSTLSVRKRGFARLGIESLENNRNILLILIMAESGCTGLGSSRWCAGSEEARARHFRLSDDNEGLSHTTPREARLTCQVCQSRAISLYFSLSLHGHLSSPSSVLVILSVTRNSLRLRLPLQRACPVCQREQERQQRESTRRGECNPQGIAVQRPNCLLQFRGKLLKGEDRLPQFFDELKATSATERRGTQSCRCTNLFCCSIAQDV